LQTSASFTGVHSKNLVLLNPQESWVDSKIRAAIRSKNYRCDPSNFTQETLLIYQSLSIPNAFSPDNDGQNENWIIEGLGQFPNHELTIYSRWETLVLREAPYKNDWNGELRASYSNSNEQNLPEGTYFYILELGNGQPPLKGFIYLKR
jgi:gliding motility-associated-like protein